MNYRFRVFYLSGLNTGVSVSAKHNNCYSIFIDDKLAEKERMDMLKHALFYIDHNEMKKQDNN